MSDPGDDLGMDLLRGLEEEETRREEGKEGEQRLRRSLYEPSADLIALSKRFIGAAIEVHRHLGPGFTETIYARALCRELTSLGLPYRSEVPLDVTYKDEVVGEFRLDLLIDNQLVVELKSVERITSVHVAQTISYLRASRTHLGLIVNFNVSLLQHGLRRVVWSAY